MDEAGPVSGSRGGLWALPAFLLFALVGWGVLTQSPRLRSSRPVGGDPPSPRVDELQDISARLWQDPLTAVVTRRGRPSSGLHAAAGGLLRREETRRSGAEQRSVLVEQLRNAINDIRTYQEGAFCPVTQYPVIRAVLIPFGGMGSIAMLEGLVPILGLR